MPFAARNIVPEETPLLAQTTMNGSTYNSIPNGFYSCYPVLLSSCSGNASLGGNQDLSEIPLSTVSQTYHPDMVTTRIDSPLSPIENVTPYSDRSLYLIGVQSQYQPENTQENLVCSLNVTQSTTSIPRNHLYEGTNSLNNEHIHSKDHHYIYPQNASRSNTPLHPDPSPLIPSRAAIQQQRKRGYKSRKSPCAKVQDTLSIPLATCTFCPASFSGPWGNGNLSRHMNNKHPDARRSGGRDKRGDGRGYHKAYQEAMAEPEAGSARTFMCEDRDCNKSYARSDALLKHLRKAHAHLLSEERKEAKEKE